MHAKEPVVKKLIILIVLIACVSIVCVVPTISGYATEISIGKGIIQANVTAGSGVGDLSVSTLKDIQSIADFLIKALEKNSDVSNTIYKYFDDKPATGTALDSTGINYAPTVREEMIEATGIDTAGKYSWRIYRERKDNNNKRAEYNIFVTNVDISTMNEGDSIDFVLKYQTATDEWVHAKSNVIRAVVDKKDIINRINGDEKNGFEIIEYLEMSQGVLKPLKKKI